MKMITWGTSRMAMEETDIYKIDTYEGLESRLDVFE